MADLIKSYVAVLPDGTEYADEVRYWSHGHDRVYNSAAARSQFAEAAVQHAKLVTSRQNPQTVRIQLFLLEIQKGKMVRLGAGTVDVTPPLQPMTSEEFELELQQVLGEVPNAFRPYVRHASWDTGHSSGFEEVLGVAREMVAGLKPAIAAYYKELTSRKGA